MFIIFFGLWVVCSVVGLFFVDPQWLAIPLGAVAALIFLLGGDGLEIFD